MACFQYPGILLLQVEQNGQPSNSIWLGAIASDSLTQFLMSGGGTQMLYVTILQAKQLPFGGIQLYPLTKRLFQLGLLTVYTPFHGGLRRATRPSPEYPITPSTWYMQFCLHCT